MQTSFALQPDLQFKFFLCCELGRLPAEIDSMTCIDYHRFAIHYERKQQAESRAMDEAKRGGGIKGHRSF